jgi:acyl dehydratase
MRLAAMFDDGRLAYDDIADDLAWMTPGITVTESHIFAFAGLSGDFYEIHTDDDYARALGYPGRVAHGILGLALADGLKNRASVRLAAIVSLGWRWRFSGPIFVGDRLEARIKVIAKRLTRQPDRGIVTLDLTMSNQRREVVQAGENDLMVHRERAVAS